MTAEVEWVEDPDGGIGRIHMMLMLKMMMVWTMMVGLMIMNDDPVIKNEESVIMNDGLGD